MKSQIEGQPADVRESLFQKQVCVPKSFTDAEIEDFANSVPCGTRKGWTINKGTEGSPEKVQCSKFPSHVHVILDA